MSSSSEIDIKDLFDESRFPKNWRLLSVLIYTPIGIVLMLLRFLICLQLWLLASFLPDCKSLCQILHKGLALAFGIFIRVDPDGEKRDDRTRIFIANNISALDAFVLYGTANTLTPTPTNLQSCLGRALGFEKMDMTNKDTLSNDIKRFLADKQGSNIALQPEFSATNGRAALLKFNTWPFAIESYVQPVTLQAWRPDFVDIRLTSLASSWWTDVMWFMFVPFTVFKVKFLKTKNNENSQVLARDVEKDIAQSLNVKTSVHTVSDKTEYEKRYILEKVQNRVAPSAAVNTIGANLEIQRMAQQVSEVFPLVPYNVILKDLLKTRNVDVTITNILDGIVTYTPILPNTSSKKPEPAKFVSPNNTLTFQERKEKMIAEARLRYIEKHGLKDC